MPTEIQSTLNQILQLQHPFWKDGGFWISLIVGSFGLYFSIRAFVEARRAKHAATEAGRTVKLQTVTIELVEIAQKLDRMKPEMRFNEARDLLNEISRRLRRAVSPFAKDSELSAAIDSALQALQAAQKSLKSVRPTDPAKEAEAPNAVYYAIEDDFANINNYVADLLGLFEKQTYDFGEDDGES